MAERRCSDRRTFAEPSSALRAPSPEGRRKSEKHMSSHNGQRLPAPGFALTLRPLRYPQFYEMYRSAIRNTWTVEEVDFSLDVNDLKHKFGPAERHLIERLIAFFATGDSILSNN